MDEEDYIIGSIVAVVSGILYFFQNTIVNLAWPLYLGLVTFSAHYGYLIVFLAGLLTPFLPFIPAFASLVVFILATTKLNPLLLGIFAGIGVSTGDILFILSGRGINSKELSLKYGYKMKKIKQLFEKRDYFGVFIFSLVPLSENFALSSLSLRDRSYHSTFAFYSLGKIVMNILIALIGYYSMSAVNALLGVVGPIELYFIFISTLAITYAFSRLDWLSLVVMTLKRFHLKSLQNLKQFDYRSVFLNVYQFYRFHPFFTLLTFSLIFLYISLELISPMYHVIIVAYVMLLLQLGVLLEREKRNK
ncbi:MAG: hypothetical protein ACP6IS_02775 [Candidatus Asgardarchaeia archaeon]